MTDLILTLASGLTTTCDKKELKALLLSSGGWTFRNGYIHDICSKHLGAGVYKVWLEARR